MFKRIGAKHEYSICDVVALVKNSFLFSNAVRSDENTEKVSMRTVSFYVLRLSYSKVLIVQEARSRQRAKHILSSAGRPRIESGFVRLLFFEECFCSNKFFHAFFQLSLCVRAFCKRRLCGAPVRFQSVHAQPQKLPRGCVNI